MGTVIDHAPVVALVKTVNSGPMSVPSIERRTSPEEGTADSIRGMPCSSRRVPAMVMVSPAIPVPDTDVMASTVGASITTRVVSELLARPVVPASPLNEAKTSMKPATRFSSTVNE